jgi:hypothetical protein
MVEIDLSFAPTKTKKLLRDYQSSKITMQDLERECAYWLLTDACFKEMRVLLMPSRPQILLDYDREGFAKKEAINRDPTFWKQPIVINYLEEKQRVKHHNQDCVSRLKDAKNLIPEGDTLSHTKIDQRLNDFLSWMPPVAVLPKNYNEREIGEEG